MRSIAKDLAVAARLLFRDRLFSATALLTLALCIGANAALFGVVQSVLLKPLPFSEPDRLVRLNNSYPNVGVTRAGNGVVDLLERRELPAFASLAMWQTGSITVGEAGNVDRIPLLQATPSFFPLLGIASARGRTFDESDGMEGAARVALLSHGLWQERYGGRTDALGETVRLNGNEYEIIGVLPAGFRIGSSEPRVVIPIVITAAMTTEQARHNNNYSMLGRLAPGATLEQAVLQVQELNRRNDELYPQYRDVLQQAGFTTLVEGFHDDLIRDVRGTLLLLQAGVLIVLLIGCVNIANLLLVRATARAREWATRAALGASFGRLARQLVTESVVLAVVGGAIGLLLGYLALASLDGFAAEHIPRGTEIAMDSRVVAATAMLSLLAGALFGLLPLARLRRTDLSAVFREDARSATASRAALAVRGALVTTQVALAFVLLAGAGLTLTSFARTLAIDPGFRSDGVITSVVSLPTVRYTNAEARRAFTNQLVDEIGALPGIEHASVASSIPFGSSHNSSVVTAENRRTVAGEPPAVPWINVVTPDYFAALRVQLVRGRLLERSDDENGMRVIVIDEALANQLWPGEDPLGKRAFIGAYEIGMPEDEIVMRTVVGVVRSVRVQGLVGEQPVGQFYLPQAQQPGASLVIVARSALPPLSQVAALRRVVTTLDPELPLHTTHALDELVSASLVNERARTILLGGFAALALLLAAVGLYGVLAYTVAQRKVEIGIRMAVGGSTRDVFALVLRQGLALVLAGLVIGAAVTAAGGRVLVSMLHGVSIADPLVHGAVTTLLVLVAITACAVPAWRAARVDPAGTLRG